MLVSGRRSHPGRGRREYHQAPVSSRHYHLGNTVAIKVCDHWRWMRLIVVKGKAPGWLEQHAAAALKGGEYGYNGDEQHERVKARERRCWHGHQS